MYTFLPVAIKLSKVLSESRTTTMLREILFLGALPNVLVQFQTSRNFCDRILLPNHNPTPKNHVRVVLSLGASQCDRRNYITYTAFMLEHENLLAPADAYAKAMPHPPTQPRKSRA